MFKLLASGVVATILSLFSIAPAFANDTGIASMLHSLRGESGKVCMIGHYHHGESPKTYPSRAAAYKAAIHNWKTFTVAEYGTDWGSYRNSSNRSNDCEKRSRTSWSCKVMSRPCRRGLNMARR